jgi:tetratricopeptide (TPR) repeat protein
MNSECRGKFSYSILLCLLLAAVVFLSGCTNPETAKADHLAKGEAYLKDNKFQEATLEFRNALQIDETLGAAYWGLARAYEGLQRFPEMIEALRNTIKFDANNLDARQRLGNYLMLASKGRPEVIAEAEKLAKEILAKDPKHIEGHILMGSVLFAQNQKDKAFAELNHAIELDPKRVESYLSLARFHIVTGETPKAEELFKRAIAINANSALAHVEYGKFLVQTNRGPEAEAEFRKAVEVEPNDRTARFVMASYYLVNKQYDKAEEQYRALAALDKEKPESQAVLADFYSAINRTDESVKIYQDILAKAPDFMQGRYRLAEILLMRGDSQGANAQIEEALKKDKNDRQALLLRARMRGMTNQNDGMKAAIEDLKEVLRQEPTSRAGLYFMAQMNFNLGYLDQARAFAGDLEKNYPEYLPAKLMQVQITLSTGDAKAATTMATDLLARLDKTAPDRDNSPQLLGEIRLKTLLARGTAQVRTNAIPAAKKDFETARDLAPNDPNTYNNLASVALAENKPQDSIAFFEQALKVDQTNFNALNGLIQLYARNGEIDKAHARLDQALSSYPNIAALHYLKAQAYGHQQKGQEAEAELRKTLELDGNYIAAYSSLGALFINAKKEDLAIAEYQKILARQPDNASAYTLIGMLEDQRQRYDAAVDNYKKALEKDPNSAIAANNLAWLYAVTGKGNLDEAIRLAQSVVQKYPNVAGFIDTLGWVYYKKNLHSAAVEQLQKAVAISDGEAATSGFYSASYHYHLGMALKARGDKAAAKRELEAAIKYGEKVPFPDVEEAKKALATL